MDFVLSSKIDLRTWTPKLEQLRSNHCDDVNVVLSNENLQLLTFGGGGVEVSESGAVLWDGQFSNEQSFFHPFLRPKESAARIAAHYLATRSTPPNGIFFYAQLAAKPTAFILMTDWLGQYPIYYWRSGCTYLVSNNILMLEAILPNSSRSVVPALENLVYGGSLTGTHVLGVERLPFGHMIEATDELAVLPRSDHNESGLDTYDETIEMARKSIRSHILAVSNSVGQDTSIVADITGGSDSRCVLSFLLEQPDLIKRVAGRCITQYPNPDANVAGLVMERYGIPPSKFPVTNYSSEKTVRINAALSGGGRDSGSAGSSIAFTNFLHFKGSFGEIGGATPGIDYVQAAVELGNYTHKRAVDIYLERRRTARALELVTRDGVEAVRGTLVRTFEELEREGHPRDHLIAELYIRKRCRTHFGLLTFNENRSRILPEPLANRWIVEARRLLPARQHTNNKVIFDLILSNGAKELAFLPFANKRWSHLVVPDAYKSLLETIPVVDSRTAPLSRLTGPLYMKDHHRDTDPRPVKLLARATPLGSSMQNAQGQHIAPYMSMLRHLRDHIDATHEVWSYFNRDAIDLYLTRDPSDFAASGIDINAAGTVCAAIFWKLGFAIAPAVTSQMTLKR